MHSAELCASSYDECTAPNSVHLVMMDAQRRTLCISVLRYFVVFPGQVTAMFESDWRRIRTVNLLQT